MKALPLNNSMAKSKIKAASKRKQPNRNVKIVTTILIIHLFISSYLKLTPTSIDLIEKVDESGLLNGYL